MFGKVVDFNKEGRNKVMEGINIVGKAVGSTIGASGSNVVLPMRTRVDSLSITNDGITVAKEIRFKDQQKQIGRNLLVSCASRTNRKAGDGTSTTIVLAHEMVKLASKLDIKNPQAFRRGMLEAKEEIINEIKKSARTCKELKTLEQVATVSVEDEVLGKKIAKAVYDGGEDGVISVDRNDVDKIEMERIPGYQLGSGVVSTMLTKDGGWKDEIEKPLVLVVNANISNMKRFLYVIHKLLINNSGIVIVANDFAQSVVATSIKVRLQNQFNIYLVRVNEAGNQRLETMKDIATLVGTKVLTSKDYIDFATEGEKIEQLDKRSCFGEIKKVKFNEFKTTFISDADVSERVKQLEEDKVKAGDKTEEDIVKYRISKLKGGITQIKVGATTDEERSYLCDKVEDAVNSTRNAFREGIVEGGGMCYVKQLKNEIKKEQTDFDLGKSIVYKSLIAPYQKIITNAFGKEESDKILQEGKNTCYNVKYGKEVKDPFKEGIIDSAITVVEALENSVSAVATFLTTNTFITYDPKDKSNQDIL